MPETEMNPNRPDETRLESWKEIAAYLQRNAVTVRRWEKEEGLPIHRHAHKSRSSVYAYAHEIEDWRQTRKLLAEPPPPAPIWNRFVSPSFFGVIVISMLTVGSFQPMEAQQGQTKTLVCSGKDCANGSISPDGKFVWVRPKPNVLAIRNIATKADRTVAENPDGVRVVDIHFSPDGSRLAYGLMPNQSGGRHEDKVFVVNRDGTNSRPINFQGGYPVGWSADSKRLLVEVDSGDNTSDSLQWVTISNGATQKLPAQEPYRGAAVSPDGKYIAFLTVESDKQPNIHVMSSDGSGENKLSQVPASPRLVGWTPDGRYLLYRAAPAGLFALRMSNGKIEGPAIDTHLDLPQNVNVLGIDRSGTIYYYTVFSRRDHAMATLDPSTGRATSSPKPLPLSEGDSNNLLARFSPDGNKIVFYKKPATEPVRDIRIYSFESSKEDTIRPRAAMAGGPLCLSPGGESLVMSAFKDSPQPQPHSGFRQQQVEPIRIDLKTGEEKELFPGGASSFYTTGCAGDLLVGTDPAGTALKVRNVQSGSETELYRFATPRGWDFVGARLSRDGSQIAFFEQLDSNTTALEVMPSAGGPVRQLVTAKLPQRVGYWGAAWSPDDRFVYFCKSETEEVTETFRIPAAGGTIESTGYKSPMGGLDISPDGTRILSGWGQWQVPQIWAIRNFLPSK